MKNIKKRNTSTKILIALLVCAPIFVLLIPYFLSIPALVIYAMIVSWLTNRPYSICLVGLVPGTLISALVGMMIYLVIAQNVGGVARVGTISGNIVVAIVFILANRYFLKRSFLGRKRAYAS